MAFRTKARWGVLISFVVITAFVVLYANCGPPPTITRPTDATSLSEVVEALISGTVNSTFATGTQARFPAQKRPISFASLLKNNLELLPEAQAQVVTTAVCPTMQAGGTNCAVGGPTGNILTLSFATCNFPGETAVWAGSEIFSHTSGPATLTCGAFPTYANGDVVTRSFAVATGVFYPNSLAVLVDTSNTVSGNPAVTTSGLTISFTGAVARTIVINGVHIAADSANYILWSYLLTSGPILVSGANAVNGTVSVQDVLKNRTATSNLNALTYTNGCCFPTGGSVATSFSDGTSESLTFNSCGSANYNGKAITLLQCY